MKIFILISLFLLVWVEARRHRVGENVTVNDPNVPGQWWLQPMTMDIRPEAHRQNEPNQPHPDSNSNSNSNHQQGQGQGQHGGQQGQGQHGGQQGQGQQGPGQHGGQQHPTPHPTPRPTPHPTPRPTPHPTPRPTPHPTPAPTTSAPSQTPTSTPSPTPVSTYNYNVNDLLYYWGGTVDPSLNIYNFFLGPSWTSSDPRIQAIQTFEVGMTGSSYIATNNQYFPPGTSASFTHMGNTINNINRYSTSEGQIISYICNHYRNTLSSVADHVAVFTDTPRGSNTYCAYHSAASCGGPTFTFSFYFDVSNDPGCSVNYFQPDATQNIVNLVAHELSETITDWNGDAWYDLQGQENMDKCSWVFPYIYSFPNGQSWIVQPIWSDLAYESGTGYPNLQGLPACV